jgi:hypothetical protein
MADDQRYLAATLAGIEDHIIPRRLADVEDSATP